MTLLQSSIEESELKKDVRDMKITGLQSSIEESEQPKSSAWRTAWHRLQSSIEESEPDTDGSRERKWRVTIVHRGI